MERFFWLKQDDRIAHAILLKGIIQQISLTDIRKGVLDSVPDLTVFPVSISSEYNIYPDVLSSQIFMIKDGIKQVFDIIDKKIKYKKIYAMDAPNEISHLYYIPVLSHIDGQCTLLKSEKSWENKLEIICSENMNKHIFSVLAEDKLETIISLPVAEAILRRQPKNIRLVEVKILRKNTL